MVAFCLSNFISDREFPVYKSCHDEPRQEFEDRVNYF
jgi:hypothetical protein